MKALYSILTSLFFFGCDHYADGPGKATRFLKLTAGGPPELSWEVMTHYEATRGIPLACVSFGLEGGGWRFDHLTELDTVFPAGDSVRIPLDRGKSLCDWELKSIYIQDQGGHYLIGGISIAPPGVKPEDTPASFLLPDTIVFTCHKDSEAKFKNCDIRDHGDRFQLASRTPKPLHFKLVDKD